MRNDGITIDDSQMNYEDSDSFNGLTSEEEVESNEKDVNGSANIIYYTTEFDLMSLAWRIEDEEIIVPSFIKNKKISNEQTDKEGNKFRNFQRGFVWGLRQKQNLIDSILKGYPMPGIFLLTQKDGTFLVLDGQQRLTTIAQFRAGDFSVDTSSIRDIGFAVEDENKEYKYDDLDGILKRRFNNYRISATIIDDILPKSSDSIPNNSGISSDAEDYIYSIFGRLNSGGTQLTPHEIRISVYSGKLADKINELNTGEKWRSLYRGELQKRSRDHEVISRIIAMYLNRENYKGGQKEYLNKFYRVYRNFDSPEIQHAVERFSQVIDTVHPIGPKLFRTPGTSNVNAAWTEAIISSTMVILDSYPNIDSDKLREAVENTQHELMNGKKYSVYGEEKSLKDFITSNTSSKVSYFGRFEICYISLQEHLK